MFSNKKYIFLNNYTYCAGLNDLKDRFTEYIKVSIILNLIPIMPVIYLSDFHTKKTHNLLTDYIDIPKFVCTEFPSNTDEIFYWNLTNNFIPCDNLYHTHREQILNLKLNIGFLEKYKIIAREVIRQLKKPICVVHVRRGDYLNICNSLHYTTSPENIKNVLHLFTFQMPI